VACRAVARVCAGAFRLATAAAAVNRDWSWKSHGLSEGKRFGIKVQVGESSTRGE